MIKLNGFDVPYTLFPDNTSQVWKLPPEAIPPYTVLHKIEWEFSHEGEFLQLAQLKTLLDSYNYSSELYLTYLPYGRQDKEVSNTSTFALHTFSSLLNSLNFKAVWCLDPHSKVAGELINNFIPYYPYVQLYKVKELLKSTAYCYPDQGASSKYNSVYKNYEIEEIYVNKRREPKTGIILESNIARCSLDVVKNANILLVDDICDGGKTFTALTELLKLNGAREVNLFVTHGIFSKGLRVLHNSGINRVFSSKGEAFEEQGHIVYRSFE